jgi:hypothetical protein
LTTTKVGSTEMYMSDTQKCAAIVTVVNEESFSLTIFPDGGGTEYVKECTEVEGIFIPLRETESSVTEQQ